MIFSMSRAREAGEGTLFTTKDTKEHKGTVVRIWVISVHQSNQRYLSRLAVDQRQGFFFKTK